MKILFIAPYPKGRAPSQRFRFEQYFRYLALDHIDCELAPFWSEKGWNILYSKGNYLRKFTQLILGFLRRIFLMFRIRQYDRILIHREATPIGPPMFEMIIVRWFNKKFYFDFDDAVWMDNTSKENELVARLKYHNKVPAICRWADKVSCGNQWLAEYASQFNRRVVVLPTTIDIDHHKPLMHAGASGKVTIGWTGTHSTGRYLTMLKKVLRGLHERFSIDFLVISNHPPDSPDNFWRYEPWDKEKEIRQLQDMDIGIMPLEDTDWEKGKCGFKALQYMAVGIPAVVSPVGVNIEIIEHGVSGYLCETDNEWSQAVTELITDADKRKEVGRSGRKRVEQLYSSKVNKEIFYQILDLDDNNKNKS